MKRIISNFQDWQDFANIVVERMQKSRRPFEIKIKSSAKTIEQLGYFHSEVLPKLTYALYDTGDIAHKCEETAKYWLKLHLNFGKWIEYGNGVVFVPDSFTGATIKILSRAIELAIHESHQRGVLVNPPVTKETQKEIK